MISQTSHIQPEVHEEEEDDNDFSDMPTLTRVDQMDHSDSTISASRPESSAKSDIHNSFNTFNSSNSTSFSRSASRASTTRPEEENEKATIAITPGMDLTEMAERLMSTLDSEKVGIALCFHPKCYHHAFSPSIQGCRDYPCRFLCLHANFFFPRVARASRLRFLKFFTDFIRDPFASFI